MTALPQATLSVQAAIEKYKQGSTKDFDALLGRLTNQDIKDEVLISYLRQFQECITVLKTDFENIVGVILKIDWLKREETLCREYQSFIINLVSAHPVYLKACLRMIVKHFMPNVINVGKADGQVDNETRQTHEFQFYHLHVLLGRISQIVPMTPVVLVPLLEEYFPYLTKSTYLHEVYVKNLLQISTYLPKERSKILSTIIDRMAKLDARAARVSIEKEEEEDGDENSDSEDIVDTQFDMDDMEDLKSEAKSESKPVAPLAPMKHRDADRLDAMMDVIYRVTYMMCHPDGKLDWAATKKLYLEYLSIFDKIILPSHALCHTQFILFYLCSFKEDLTIGFIDFLWKKVSMPLTEVIYRQTAASYIGSLLARAKYVGLRTVISTLDIIMDWVHKYVMEAAHSSYKAGISHHGTFYAVCQSVFYIIIFRHKHLLATSAGYKFVQQLKLQTVVTSRLNPLKFCLPIIVKTFASVMRQHQMVFCDTIIERNRRSVLSVEGTDVLHSVNPLDSFFPFDPYLLSRSGNFIKPLYQDYEGTPASPDADSAPNPEEEFEKQMEAEFGSTPGDAFPISPSPSTDFLMYGTSPGFMNT